MNKLTTSAEDTNAKPGAAARGFSSNKYLIKTYDPINYNCWQFAQEIWAELTGVDLGNQTPGTHSTEAYTEKATEFSISLRRLDRPTSPCLVLMQRPQAEPHVGVFYKGSVLHLRKEGAQYRPLSQVSALYPKISFYTNPPKVPA